MAICKLRETFVNSGKHFGCPVEAEVVKVEHGREATAQGFSAADGLFRSATCSRCHRTETRWF